MAGRDLIAALAASLALLAGGCGGGEAGSTTSSKPAPSATGSHGGGTGGEQIPVGDGRGGVSLEKLGDFDSPVYVAQAPGGSDLFVVEQTGRVIRLPAGGGRPQTFLDVTGRVSCCGEQGLLSMAFPRNYARTGLFYVDYTDTSGDTRVVEYRASGGSVDPGSARAVLAVDQPFSNHNGGLLQFGPDGLLYIGLGDGGSEGDPQRNGQDLGTDLAKLLRIDPREFGRRPYTVPASNPFVGRQGARPEIYSYGLRNPWRFSFDRANGNLWIGDVGQDTFEEVDGVARGQGRGANFGWSAFEGEKPFNDDQSAPGAVPPVLTYTHDQGCSVTGGYVVRDPRLTSLYGRYLYGDFCQGELRSFPATPDRPAAGDRPVGVQVPSLSSFGEDLAGHLYATSLDGPVYRLVQAG